MRENMLNVRIPLKERRGAHETGSTETSAVFHSSQAEKLTNFTEAH